MQGSKIKSAIKPSLWGCQLRTFATATLVLVASSFLIIARADSPQKIKTFRVNGVFMEARSAAQVAIIAHDAIPGYMDAMTMPFKVRQPAELTGLQPGDKITFQLSVTETEAWIEDIKKTGVSALVRRSVPPPQQESVPELKAGELVPDSVLTNQAGQTIHLRDFKGQAFALTFFFSRCPLPTFCPRMNNNFAAVQQALQRDVTRTNWQLLSVSFDPSFDTPENLKDFATIHQSDARHWNFATSSPEEIRKLGGAFGLRVRRENGSFSHNLRTAVIDASGSVRKVFTGSEWQAAELIAEMKKAMRTRP